MKRHLHINLDGFLKGRKEEEGAKTVGVESDACYFENHSLKNKNSFRNRVNLYTRF